MDAKLASTSDPFPPAHVTAGAICGPADAPLFDAAGEEESWDEAAARIAEAVALCEICPVQMACRLDGLNNAREGVYGGLYLGWLPKRHRLTA